MYSVPGPTWPLGAGPGPTRLCRSWAGLGAVWPGAGPTCIRRGRRGQPALHPAATAWATALGSDTRPRCCRPAAQLLPDPGLADAPPLPRLGLPPLFPGRRRGHEDALLYPGVPAAAGPAGRPLRGAWRGQGPTRLGKVGDLAGRGAHLLAQLTRTVCLCCSCIRCTWTGTSSAGCATASCVVGTNR